MRDNNARRCFRAFVRDLQEGLCGGFQYETLEWLEKPLECYLPGFPRLLRRKHPSAKVSEPLIRRRPLERTALYG